MKHLQKFAALTVVSAMLCSSAAFAQDHDDRRDNRNVQREVQRDNRNDQREQRYDNHQYVQHREWRRGHRMRVEDWRRGERISDWRIHNLRRPPRGYEWREVDGNYVLAAVATGLIASIIAATAGR